MGAWLFIIFVAAPLLGTILYWIISGLRSAVNGPEPLPEWEQPAGRIHLFETDTYLDSSPNNPFEHPLLPWSEGKLSCALSTDLVEHPEYQAALIGTIQVLKPAGSKGVVAGILDSRKVAELGLHPAGLVSGAQMLADQATPKATLDAS